MPSNKVVSTMSRELYNGNRNQSLEVEWVPPRPDPAAERAYKQLTKEQRRKVRVLEGCPITIRQARYNCQMFANRFGCPVFLSNSKGKMLAFCKPR